MRLAIVTVALAGAALSLGPVQLARRRLLVLLLCIGSLLFVRLRDRDRLVRVRRRDMQQTETEIEKEME